MRKLYFRIRFIDKCVCLQFECEKHLFKIHLNLECGIWLDFYYTRYHL